MPMQRLASVDFACVVPNMQSGVAHRTEPSKANCGGWVLGTDRSLHCRMSADISFRITGAQCLYSNKRLPYNTLPERFGMPYRPL